MSSQSSGRLTSTEFTKSTRNVSCGYRERFVLTTTYWKMAMGLIRRTCNYILIYMIQRVHLTMGDRRYIINWFNKIFGKKRIKLPPPPELMPKLNVFTVP